MPDFSTARVGDRVFSINYGEGIVNDRGTEYVAAYFKKISTTTYFTLDGKTNKIDELPTLFWDKPEFTDPPPPKRMIKKKQKVWINVYPPERKKDWGSRFTIWEDEEITKPISKESSRITTIETEIEWEEEE